jgi:hypothetical protein
VTDPGKEGYTDAEQTMERKNLDKEDKTSEM